MPRKAIRVELSKEHTSYIVTGLAAYISDYEGTLEFTEEQLKDVKKLLGRFIEHLKSFEGK